jgi:acyl carrier protein
MVMNTIKQALIKELGIDPSLITDDTKVEQDLQLDSTENVVIALEIKKKYGVDYVFPSHDVSLRQISEAVDKMITEKQPS